MKILAAQNQAVEVTLTDSQQRDITASYLENSFNWNREYFISDGYVKVVKTYHSSHSWKKEETIRKASENDILADKVFKQLYCLY